MSKYSLLAVAVVLTCTTVSRPEWLSDDNAFLKDFIGKDSLAALGVILAITLASLSQVHLTLGKIRDKVDAQIIGSLRREIKSSAVWLITMFVISVVLLLIKPLVICGDTSEAVINSVALFIICFYICILIDVTMGVFDLDI